MVINIVKRIDPSIKTFSEDVIAGHRVVFHNSIEDQKRNPRQNALIVGKIVKVMSYLPEQKLYILLIKQILPNYEYGIKFKAVLKKHLAEELVALSPQTGDRVAFYDPIIFYDSAFESEPSTVKKYVLVCGTEESSFWFARKRSGTGTVASQLEMGGKSNDDESSNQLGTTDAGIQSSMGHTDLGNPKKPANTEVANPLYTYKSINSIKSADVTKCNRVNFFAVVDEITKEMGGKSNDDESSNQLGTTDAGIQSSMGHTDLGNPKKPANTEVANPLYTYKSINSIKSADVTKCNRVNFFAVVDEITKPPTITSSNNYHMMLQLVDDSGAHVRLHVFLKQAYIINQITHGDVIRLQRAKLEVYYGEVDARIFSTMDIVLFKKRNPLEPLLYHRSTRISDVETRRVETLMRWYESVFIPATTSLLSNIIEPNKYTLFCKVLKCRSELDFFMKVTVSDGSIIKTLVPSFPLEQCIGMIGEPCHLATEITIYYDLNKYSNLKENDYVLFRDVTAVVVKCNQFKLEIRSSTSPEILNERSLQVAEVESRIEQYLRKNVPEGSPNFDSIENMTSPQTNQQKNKENSTPIENIEKPGPSFEPGKVLFHSHMGDDETSDPGSKLRKPLFTPNYTIDLSNAADEETSEDYLDVSKHETKVPHEDVMNPIAGSSMRIEDSRPRNKRKRDLYEPQEDC